MGEGEGSIFVFLSELSKSFSISNTSITYKIFNKSTSYLSESMNTNTSAKEIKKGQDFITKHWEIIKRFGVMDKTRIDVWSPSNVILVGDYQGLSQQLTKVSWVQDQNFNAGSYFDELPMLPSDHGYDTLWFTDEDKYDDGKGLWIESEAQLLEKIEQIKANLEGLKAKMTENRSKISKCSGVAKGIQDLMKTLFDTPEEAALVQVISDQLSELEALSLQVGPA